MKKIKFNITYDINFFGEIEIDLEQLKNYFDEGVDINNYDEDQLYNAIHTYTLDNLNDLQETLDYENGALYIEINDDI